MTRVAIVHEWFAAYAGSERVVEQLLKLYPDADLFALVDFLPERERGFLGGRPVRTSFIQSLPFARRRFRTFLPLMPLAIEQFDLSDYDVIISSNHAVAKGIIRAPGKLHISYIHTPIRYAWDLQHQYLREAHLERGVRSWMARAMLHYVRNWDLIAANRVDAMVANSQFVAHRIWSTYRRQAVVVYPPVDAGAFPLREKKDDFYLAASRMVPYKRMDLIVEAFGRMPGRRLVVIGDGPEMKRVRAKASSNVRILGYQPFQVLRDHMQRAKAFVFAAEEDFGIIPVEAMACGTPVIAFGKGGVLETVRDGETGLFFHEQGPEHLIEAVVRFEAAGRAFDPARIREQAEKFSPERFRQEMSRFVRTQVKGFESRNRVPGPTSMPAPMLDSLLRWREQTGSINESVRKEGDNRPGSDGAPALEPAPAVPESPPSSLGRSLQRRVEKLEASIVQHQAISAPPTDEPSPGELVHPPGRGPAATGQREVHLVRDRGADAPRL